MRTSHGRATVGVAVVGLAVLATTACSAGGQAATGGPAPAVTSGTHIPGTAGSVTAASPSTPVTAPSATLPVTAAPPSTPVTAPSDTIAATKPESSVAPPLLSRGDSGVRVRELQARLKHRAAGRVTPVDVDGVYGTGTAAAVRDFQLSRGLSRTGNVDATTWARLRSETRTPSRASLYPEAATTDSATTRTAAALGLDGRCLTGRVVCADKSRRRLWWVIDGTVHSTLTVRFGRPSLPTSNGVFQVLWKDIDHKSKQYDDAPMPFSMFFHGGQAVHYSPDFVADGYGGPGGSHGCINTRDRAATAALFAQVRVGDTVVVTP